MLSPLRIYTVSKAVDFSKRGCQFLNPGHDDSLGGVAPVQLHLMEGNSVRSPHDRQDGMVFSLSYTHIQVHTEDLNCTHLRQFSPFIVDENVSFVGELLGSGPIMSDWI